MRLTEKYIRSLPLPEHYKDEWDDDPRGLFLRRRHTGNHTFFYFYRLDGRKATFRIGRWGEITLAQARKISKRQAAIVAMGTDPQVERQDARKKAAIAADSTLKSFVQNKYGPWVESSKKSGSATRQILERQFAHLLERPLDQIHVWDVEKWRYKKLKKGTKASTLNRQTGSLKTALNRAVEWGCLEGNPLAKLKPLPVDSRKKVRYLERDEELRLRSALDRREADMRAKRESANLWREERRYELYPSLDGEFADYLKPAVLLSINTGLRRGELFGLLWINVDLKRRFLTIEGDGSKSGGTRHVPLNTEAVDLLRRWQAQTKGHMVFAGKTRESLSQVTKSWKRVLKLAKIHEFRWHDLRHHFASRLVQAGVPLNTVRELLGHADLKMTLRYAHLAPDQKAEAVELLVVLNANA